MTVYEAYRRYLSEHREDYRVLLIPGDKEHLRVIVLGLYGNFEETVDVAQLASILGWNMEDLPSAREALMSADEALLAKKQQAREALYRKVKTVFDRRCKEDTSFEFYTDDLTLTLDEVKECLAKYEDLGWYYRVSPTLISAFKVEMSMLPFADDALKTNGKEDIYVALVMFIIFITIVGVGAYLFIHAWTTRSFWS